MNHIEVLSITAIIIFTAMQNILKKGYLKSGGNGVFVFSAMTVMTACLFFLCMSIGNASFSPKVIPYVIGFAGGYTAATVFNFLALRAGPLSLTSLFSSYSLLIPTAYGLIFDGDEIGIYLVIGFILLAVSLFLINSKGRAKEGRVTLKWLLFALLALVGNGACSTVQSAQSRTFEGRYDSLFMVISLAVVSLFLIGMTIVKERKLILPSLKGGIILMVAAGVSNGVVNLLVMLCSKTIDKSLLFPLISAGGIVVTWLVSAFIYKEKLSLKQNLGMLLGVASIVFLNL